MNQANSQIKTNKAKMVRLFILRRTALDGKVWWCLCYKDIKGELRTHTKYKTKKQAEAELAFYEENYEFYDYFE